MSGSLGPCAFFQLFSGIGDPDLLNLSEEGSPVVKGHKVLLQADRIQN